MNNCKYCGAKKISYKPDHWACGTHDINTIVYGPQCVRSDICHEREDENDKLKDSAQVGISGRLTIEVRDAKTGKLLREEIIENKIVTAGLNLVRDLLAANNAAPTHIAVGTDATAPTAGDTALGTEVFINVITRRIPSATQITFQLFITDTEANGNTLVEAGIFNAASLGDMLSRVTYTAIAKTAAITVTLTWEITISEA